MPRHLHRITAGKDGDTIHDGSLAQDEGGAIGAGPGHIDAQGTDTRTGAGVTRGAGLRILE